MSTIARPSPPPIDDILESAERGVEVIDGRLVEKEKGSKSNWVGGTIFHLLRGLCEPARPAWVFPDQGYVCFPSRPRRLRRPDVSVVLAERMTPDLLETGYLPIRPDLAIEVVSPRDLASSLEVKLADYRDAAIPLVWVVYPDARRVHVIRLDGATTILGADDGLDGGEILPGFRCRVADLFAGLPEPAGD